MKNTLLYYQGGGYSGCFWEWNFCFWDDDEKWHNLYVSGRNGMKTEQEALELAKTLEHKAELVDLTNADRVKQFQQDNNAIFVLQIAQELNENYGYNIELTCSECGCSFAVDRSEYDVAIDNHNIICSECYPLGCCDCCNEYVGPDEIRGCDETSADELEVELATEYDQVCDICFEYNVENNRIDKLKDLRFQAFLTGKPDIYGDELRELRG